MFSSPKTGFLFAVFYLQLTQYVSIAFIWSKIIWYNGIKVSATLTYCHKKLFEYNAINVIEILIDYHECIYCSDISVKSDEFTHHLVIFFQQYVW